MPVPQGQDFPTYIGKCHYLPACFGKPASKYSFVIPQHWIASSPIRLGFEICAEMAREILSSRCIQVYAISVQGSEIACLSTNVFHLAGRKVTLLLQNSISNMSSAEAAPKLVDQYFDASFGLRPIL